MKIVTMPYDEVTQRFNVLENDIDKLRKLIEGQLNKPIQDTYLTKKQAAKIANVATSTIDNWGRAELITRYYFGSSVRFKRVELLEYLESKKVRTV